MNDCIKGPVVLTLICSTVCAALAGAHMLTADRIRESESRQLQEALTEAFGAGDYQVLDQTFDGVNQIISDSSGLLIFDMTSSGYEKNSQHLLIGISDGAVSGIRVVSITDSPSQAAAVSDESFLSQFTGQTAPDEPYEAVSGATKSSDGIRRAVSNALQIYREDME